MPLSWYWSIAGLASWRVVTIHHLYVTPGRTRFSLSTNNRTKTGKRKLKGAFEPRYVSCGVALWRPYLRGGYPILLVWLATARKAMYYSVRASPKMLVQTCKLVSFFAVNYANLHLANLHLSWCPSSCCKFAGARPTLLLCHFGGRSKLHVGIDSFYEVLVFLKVRQNWQICRMLKSANLQIC